MQANIYLDDVISIHVGDSVPYVVITPPDAHAGDPLPVCLLLVGGGGSRESIADSAPLFSDWWASGAIPPMAIVTPSPGLSFYIEQTHGVRWESFLADELLSELHAKYNVSREVQSTAITGISGGGYGALKTAFRHPSRFGAVAAMQPMLEPGFTDAEIGARNRLHHTAGGPPELIGPERDPLAFAYNNPLSIARENMDAIRESALAIYLEAGDEDFLNAHDGTELLHRLFWDHDISHEYHLIRGADHGGPTLRPRMGRMLAWAGQVLSPQADPEAAASSPSSRAFIQAMRERFAPLRARAAEEDPTTNRRYGKLRITQPE